MNICYNSAMLLAKTKWALFGKRHGFYAKMTLRKTATSS